MQHGKALLIKGLLTLVVLYLILGLGFGMSFLNVLLITLVLGAVSYLVGDLAVLPKNGNIVATISDLGLTLVVVWGMGVLLTDIGMGTMASAALISAVVLAVGEYFFHHYILRNGPVERRHYSTSH